MNLIYVYESQLHQAIADTEKDLVNGIAFEWKDEGVFHVHTQMPQVAPSGYPCLAFFKVFRDQREYEKSSDHFDEQLFSFIRPDSKFQSSIIGIYMFLDEIKLNHKAYIYHEKKIEACEIKFIPAKSELYSRSKGLLEVDILETKHVLVIGLGSFGSHIAVELTKAGVGNFTLVDFDRIDLSNISRHICGINELGRLKTVAVRDALLIKNPFVQVETVNEDINQNRERLKELICKTDLVICATDNNRSRFNINELAFECNKKVLFGRAITRAEGGDVFKLEGNIGPCYCCLIGENGGFKYGGESEISTISQANALLPSYTSQEQKSAAVQVGLSSDILPICNLMVKLALLELSKESESGITSLEKELTYNYYFWANRREKNYLLYQPFNDAKLQPTILKWFGANVPRNEECVVCSASGI